MSLYHSPLMYVFFETYQLETERELFECSIGLPVLEVEAHLPHHRHGVVKYDAGKIILSLNWTSSDTFSADTSDGLITVFDGNPGVDTPGPYPGAISRGDKGLITDLHGHHFLFSAPSRGAGNGTVPSVRELRLMVKNLPASLVFYRDVLGMELLEQAGKTARFAAGGVSLALEEKITAPDGRRPGYDTYLIVFYTPQIESARAALLQRGLVFKGSHIAHSEIGATARFEDPSGHRICIYEPSEACLNWGSGRKVMEIMDRALFGMQMK